MQSLRQGWFPACISVIFMNCMYLYHSVNGNLYNLISNIVDAAEIYYIVQSGEGT